MPVAAIVFTDKGRQKLQRIVIDARDAVIAQLAKEGKNMNRAAAALAPDPQEEAALLSRGVPGGKGNYFGRGPVIGSPDGGRFLKQDMSDIQTAIREDDVEVEIRTGAGVFVQTGSPKRINARTGFYWQTRHRGLKGPTYPYNHHLLEALEYGGAWEVVPRADNPSLTLEPDEGVTATVMHKTIAPRAMYQTALAQNRLAVRARLERAVRTAVRQVGTR